MRSTASLSSKQVGVKGRSPRRYAEALRNLVGGIKRLAALAWEEKRRTSTWETRRREAAQRPGTVSRRVGVWEELEKEWE